MPADAAANFLSVVPRAEFPGGSANSRKRKVSSVKEKSVGEAGAKKAAKKAGKNGPAKSDYTPEAAKRRIDEIIRELPGTFDDKQITTLKRQHTHRSHFSPRQGFRWWLRSNVPSLCQTEHAFSLETQREAALPPCRQTRWEGHRQRVNSRGKCAPVQKEPKNEHNVGRKDGQEH
jgi:hypothetical protein